MSYLMNNEKVCPHDGERCDNERYCNEPGCVYGLIMWGFLVDDYYYCPAHFSLTDEDVDNNDDVYYTNWEPEDNCTECYENESCSCLDEAKAMYKDTERTTREEAMIFTAGEYKYTVPIHGSDVPATYTITAMGFKDADSIIASFPFIEWEDKRVWLIDGPSNIERPSDWKFSGTYTPWEGEHQFHQAVLVDHSKKSIYDWGLTNT